MFLRIENLSKSFSGLPALNNLSFDVKAGEIVGLIGPNGSGKSTFFNVLMDIIHKDSGKIYFENIDISAKKTHQIASFGIARTFQDSKNLSQITVAENLDLAFKYKNQISLKNIFCNKKEILNEEKENLKMIKELLKSLGIEMKENVLAKSLSYGQSKFLEILRVIASEPKLILLDEPFSGLFPEIIKLITEIIKKLANDGKTIILVEHNMKLISEICDKVIVLDAGKKIAEGTFEEIKKNKEVIDSYLGK